MGKYKQNCRFLSCLSLTSRELLFLQMFIWGHFLVLLGGRGCGNGEVAHESDSLLVSRFAHLQGDHSHYILCKWRCCDQHHSQRM